MEIGVENIYKGEEWRLEWRIFIKEKSGDWTDKSKPLLRGKAPEERGETSLKTPQTQASMNRPPQEAQRSPRLVLRRQGLSTRA
uniref:Uncharacterized protein n=1 Tax=Salix viminalis TaxID=40686 RepID=A0A6N2MAP8_SALVM